MVAASSDLKLEAKEAYFDDDFEMALHLFDRAIKIGPVTADLYSDRAQVHIKLGNHAEAVIDCDSALKLDSSLVKAYCRKGISYMKMKQFQNAKATFQCGLGFVPGDTKLAGLLNDCDGLIDNEVSNVSILKNGTEPVPVRSNISSHNACEEVSVAKKSDCGILKDGRKLLPASPTLRSSNADDEVSNVSIKGGTEPVPVSSNLSSHNAYEDVSIAKKFDCDENPTGFRADAVSLKQKRSVRKKGSWKLSLELPAPALDGQPKVFIAYDKRMKDHRPRSDVDEEKAKRIEKIIEKLEEEDLLKRCEVLKEVDPVQREHALAVHSEQYMQFIEALPLRGRQLDPYRHFIEGPIVSSPGTTKCSILGCWCCHRGTHQKIACRQVASGKFQSAFAIVRPPGHHAKAAKASGFCFFNNIAIAARYLQAEHNVEKILVVDFDVHHGNGTQDIFYEDKSVLFCSVHRAIFPQSLEMECDKIGEGEGRGYNVNVKLTQNKLKDDDLLAVFDYVFLPLAKQFKPGFVLVSAGYDAAINDPLGESLVSPSCFRELVWRLKSILNGKIVLALEGGYDLESLSSSCADSVKALVEGRAEDVQQKYEEADQKTWNAIDLVRKQFGAFWPILLEEVKSPEEYFIEPQEDKVLEAMEPPEDKVPPDLTQVDPAMEPSEAPEDGT